MNGPAQSACDKNYWIELFEVPEFGEVESDRGRVDKAAVFNALNEPSNAAFDGFFRSGDLATAEQRVHRQRSLFDARRSLRSAAPGAVIALRLDKPVKP